MARTQHDKIFRVKILAAASPSDPRSKHVSFNIEMSISIIEISFSVFLLEKSLFPCIIQVKLKYLFSIRNTNEIHRIKIETHIPETVLKIKATKSLEYNSTLNEISARKTCYFDES